MTKFGQIFTTVARSCSLTPNVRVLILSVEVPVLINDMAKFLTEANNDPLPLPCF